MSDVLELVIITGMSGAGKTVAVQSFEDLGYYCIDNMPPKLIPTFWDLMKESGKITRIALVIDLRSREFFDALTQVIASLENNKLVSTRILFLEASDKELISRYKATRRDHPMANILNYSTIEAIEHERKVLQELRDKAHLIVDTSKMKPKDLRAYIIQHFKSLNQHLFQIEFSSFGFKYGIPIDADLVMDVRFLPNPYYDEELRNQSGLDKAVYDYVMKQEDTKMFYDKFYDLLSYLIPAYKTEGKAKVSVAIGCTGGQHRSVSIAERLGDDFEKLGYHVVKNHRDYLKNKLSIIQEESEHGSKQ